MTLQPAHGFSEKELELARDAARDSVLKSGNVEKSISKYDTETGEVVITVKLRKNAADDKSRAQVLTDLQPPTPGNTAIRVNIRQDDDLKIEQTDKYIRGGGYLNASVSCTNGFNLISSRGEKASVTARHCADAVQYYTYVNHPAQNKPNSPVTLGRAFRATAYDLARFNKSTSTNPMTQTRTFYYDYESTRYVHDVGTSPVVGMLVCKFGRTTNATCDAVTDVNVDISDSVQPHDGHLYEGNIVTDDISDGGDSGGPLYYGNRAWGIASAEGHSVFDTSSYFVAADRINDSYGIGVNWNIWTCPTC